MILTLRKYAVLPFAPHLYSAIGDIIVLALTVLMIVLLMQSYTHGKRNFHLMMNMLILTAVSTAANVVNNWIMDSVDPNVLLIYALRDVSSIGLALIMFFYIRYIQTPFWVKEKYQKTYALRSYAGIAIAFVVETLGTIFRFGFYIDEDNTIHMGFSAFMLLYAMYYITIFYAIFKHRSRVIPSIFWGLLGSNCIAIAMLLIQWSRGQTSFTDVAVFFPILGLIFLFHSNPYDINTGAVSEQYFYEELDERLEKERSTVLMSCNIHNFAAALRNNAELRMEYFQFFRQNVHNGVLYQFPDGRLLLTFDRPPRGVHDPTINKMLDDFMGSYAKFNIDYRIVILETSQEIGRSADYVRLIQFIEETMPNNTTYRVEEDDIHRFYKSSYILSELEDIAHKKDLDDERIVVYCQPVYNIETGAYDTAESLMRMRLDRIGMVYPDLFIPLAEKSDLIHSISLIILNKTCGAVRTLIEEGYDIKRISVNFSTVDLRYDSFCKDVQQIISRNQIAYDKIAIEVTESQSEADFRTTKDKVIQLQALGIKFYLDDFGTGYSNFERIMEIPFDIIKFDRSLLLEYGRNEASRYMVNTFADMFTHLQYKILFEGIENDTDETACKQMNASYLQGYKYSKPIPIEQLKTFLRNKSAS
ncbi:MAG: EAL domain-containing protein [Oscillospiraceae bacterium]|nr:EAL domain-containing protein [Oscillospiraceae bacterium]